MKLYLAPMEGITGVDFRKNLQKHFGDVDVYMTPFIPASKKLNKKQLRDLELDANERTLIPQLIGNNATDILEMSQKMKDFGFEEININFGCPSGTVTSKKRGSGMLLYPDELDALLYEVFAHAPLRISVKTRIGFYDPSEWEDILNVYAKYPLSELIIHPRIRQEFYSGTPHYDAFTKAVEKISVPLVYNGDLQTPSQLQKIQELYPSVDRFMIGRGLIMRPDYARVLKGGKPATREELKAYHDDLIQAYLSIFSGPKDMIFHMKEVWSYFRFRFDDTDAFWKKLKKADTLPVYQALVNNLFESCDLSDY